MLPPNIRPPTEEQIREKAQQHFITLSDEEVEDFKILLEEMVGAYERLDELPNRNATHEYTDRNPGYRPDRNEDPHNAVVRYCRVDGAQDGELAGMDIGLKDNIALAGVEMTCGSRVFEGYVPTQDATVVTRLLDAGATITSKLNMESMAVSSAGDQGLYGPVLHPRNLDYLASGSSSGSAVALVTGDVDIALGTDQAGSIRMPAAAVGCVGLKPTHGLVPYTGVAAVGHSFDHVGPMARTVTDCARALEVLAGPDSQDPRQDDAEAVAYSERLSTENGINVGVVEEGFGLQGGSAGVDQTVRAALDAFADEGATLRAVSIPWHEDGTLIRNAIVNESHTALVRAEGVGHYVDGRYDTQLAEAFGQARRTHADEFPLLLKLRLVLGQYLADEYLGHYHAKANNLSMDLAEAYDDAFTDVDVLAMPTLPGTAIKHKTELTRLEWMDRSLGTIRNTAPFNVTGHPAISVPCGTVDSLPVGVMFVGERQDDATVLQAARAFEKQVQVDLPSPDTVEI